MRNRLITVLTFNNGVLFRTKQFTPDYRYTLNFVDAWSVDEIVVLDVTRPEKGDGQNFFNVIRRFAHKCFVPLAAGGGIRNLDDVKRYLDLGADKIVINTAALENPDFITEVAQTYGSQCVVLSIDAKEKKGWGHEVYSHFGARPCGLTPAEWASKGQGLGAGEVMVNSIDRDGSLQGYDLGLCRAVADSVDIPVLILGGAGNWKHFVEGFVEGHASAVCTQNIYHFSEKSIRSAKAHLHNSGIAVRL